MRGFAAGHRQGRSGLTTEGRILIGIVRLTVQDGKAPLAQLFAQDYSENSIFYPVRELKDSPPQQQRHCNGLSREGESYPAPSTRVLPLGSGIH